MTAAFGLFYCYAFAVILIRYTSTKLSAVQSVVRIYFS